MSNWYNPHYNSANASAPIVVQGQPYIASVYDTNPNKTQSPPPSSSSQYHVHKDDTNNTSSTNEHLFDAQNKYVGGYRDVIWAILFYLHLAAMLYAAIVYGSQIIGNAMVVEYDDNGGRTLEEMQEPVLQPTLLLILIGVAGVLGFVLSSIAMVLLMTFAETLIKAALIFNIVVAVLMAIVSLVLGSIQGALIGAFMCVVSIYYTCKVWSHIPFAASNLVTALTAVQANIGLAMYAYISLVLLFGWTIWWIIAAVSTILVLADCNEDGECNNEVSGVLIFVFLVSYFWTSQVIVNVVHTTTAGTVGTWWFQPHEANGCCSKAVRDSYIRSLTTSFGSICLGSLVVAIIQATKEMVRSIREDSDSLVACCADCLLGCLESLIEYFNKWAYVYVGLYGNSFMEAGKNVMTLFRERGWTVIISDMMVDAVLSMISFGVGLLTAMVAVLFGAVLSIGNSETLFTAACLSFGIGFGMSATLFSVVSSGVNTVIVCYAEAPQEFQANHPELSNRMRDSWRAAWPNEFGY